MTASTSRPARIVSIISAWPARNSAKPNRVRNRFWAAARSAMGGRLLAPGRFDALLLERIPVRLKHLAPRLGPVPWRLYPDPRLRVARRSARSGHGQSKVIADATDGRSPAATSTSAESDH